MKISHIFVSYFYLTSIVQYMLIFSAIVSVRPIWGRHNSFLQYEGTFSCSWNAFNANLDGIAGYFVIKKHKVIFKNSLILF